MQGLIILHETVFNISMAWTRKVNRRPAMPYHIMFCQMLAYNYLLLAIGDLLI